jgi:hypothetical protein
MKPVGARSNTGNFSQSLPECTKGQVAQLHVQQGWEQQYNRQEPNFGIATAPRYVSEAGKQKEFFHITMRNAGAHGQTMTARRRERKSHPGYYVGDHWLRRDKLVLSQRHRSTD